MPIAQQSRLLKQAEATDGTETARIFFALRPDEYCAERLHTIASNFGIVLGGSVARRDTLHLTLVFVGNVPAEKLPDLLRMTDELADEMSASIIPPAKPEPLTLDRLGYWTHNRILWAAASHCPAIIEALAGQLAKKLRDRGYVIPVCAFTPHVTLVRRLKVPPSAGEIYKLDLLRNAPVQWRYRDFALFRSRQSSLGAVHETLGCWKLPGI